MKLFRPRPGWFRLTFLLIAVLLIVAIFYFWRKTLSQSAVDPQRSGQISASGMPLKIVTSAEGLFELDLTDLLPASIGEGSSDVAKLDFTNQGHVRNFWIDENQGKLRFYARALDERYTSENIHWLSLKPLAENQQAAADSSDSAATTTNDVFTPPQIYLTKLPPKSYAASSHLEENLVYNPLVNDGAPWLWALLPAPTSKEITVKIINFTPGPGMIRLLFWGSTESTLTPDHHLLILVNGVQIADDAWDGRGRRLIEVEIPPGVLTKGDNQIQIDLPGDLDASADVIYLDWMEIIYPSPFIANDDRLSFVSPGGKISVRGFTGPVDIYQITPPDQVIKLAGNVDAEAGFDSQAGERYWVVGPSGYLTVNRVEPALLSPDLLSTENNADYLAIGPPELLAPLQPLLDLRAQQGLKVMAIPIQAIYDQFNHGLADPQAILSLLGYAKQNWTQSPKYLALIGDASYDPKGYQSPTEANQLPTFFVQTIHGGETASDYGFSIPGESTWQSPGSQSLNIPEVAVGRIPARNPKQVADYVKKVIAYEQSAGQLDPSDPWQKRILAVADGSDPSFKNEAEYFLGRISADYRTELLAPQSGDQGVNQVISTKINQGDWLVAYFGHGSINLWGKDQLFTIQDILGLENLDRLPVILNFTCLNGLFTHPKEMSLAEAFLWQPDGGAVAVLAPSSLTLPEDQGYLSNSIANELMNGANARLGELLTRARIQMLAENPSDRDVLFTFLLFGDPALRLASPVIP